jgi:hypothetical protein
MTPKFIPEKNAQKLLTILRKIQEHFDPEKTVFKLYDTETHLITTKNPEKILSEMDGGDEECSIEVCTYPDRVCKGTLYCLPYDTEDCMPYDCSQSLSWILEA